MAEPVKAAPVAIAVSIGLGILALLFWALTLATLADLAGSDPADNAYAQPYGAFGIFILWSLLAVIAIIAGVKGVIAWPAALAAAILIPASGFVTFEALSCSPNPAFHPSCGLFLFRPWCRRSSWRFASGSCSRRCAPPSQRAWPAELSGA